MIETAQQGRDPALLFGKNQPLVEAARSGALGPGLEAQAGPHDPSLHDGTAAPGTDRPLPLDPGSSPTDNADGAEVQTQTAKTEASPSGREEGKTPSVSTPDLATRAGDNGRALTDRPEARNHLPQDVVRAGLVDGQQAGQLPASGSDSLRNSGAGLTEFPRPDPASGRVNESAVATTALGLTGAEPVEALQRENSSALLLMAQQTRSTAATDPVTPARQVIGSEPALAPATAPSTSADPATAGGAPPLPVTHRDPARPENHSAIRPDQAGVAAGSGSPSDGLPTPVLPPSRPSAARPAAAANTDTPSANAFVSHGQHQTDANSPTSASSPRNQVERLQASPLATQTKPSTGTAADNALQAALSDVATQPDVEAGGSERIHSFLAAEGDPHRLERLDLNATGAASGEAARCRLSATGEWTDRPPDPAFRK